MNRVRCWHNVFLNPRKDIDGFHCFDLDECGDCPYCALSERYKLMGKVFQHYKSGFEVWKDWDDVKESLYREYTSITRRENLS